MVFTVEGVDYQFSSATEGGSTDTGQNYYWSDVSNPPMIIVEHRERLCRFGFEYVEAALAGRGARVLVVEDGEVEDDLVRDVTEVMTSLCARLYGRRSARRRAERAVAAARNDS